MNRAGEGYGNANYTSYVVSTEKHQALKVAYKSVVVYSVNIKV